MAVSTNKSLRSLQRAKNELVFNGLLDVIKLNASSYCILLGYEAIENHYTKYDYKESKKIYQKALESIGIVDEKETKKIDSDILVKVEDYISIEYKLKYNNIIKRYPMPIKDVF